MAHMVYQRYTSAVLDAYADDPEPHRHLESARAHREWLESLELGGGIKSPLVEQARAIEEAFGRLVKRRARDLGGG